MGHRDHTIFLQIPEWSSVALCSTRGHGAVLSPGSQGSPISCAAGAGDGHSPMAARSVIFPTSWLSHLPI